MLLVLQLATTLPMTGLIWFVQISHYPLFAAVDTNSFPAYEARNRIRTTAVVGPLMLVEAASTVLLFGMAPSLVRAGEAMLGAGLLLAIWISTAAIQVPCHHRLSRGFDARTWRRLVLTNWIRTAAWSCRSVLLLSILWRRLP